MDNPRYDTMNVKQGLLDKLAQTILNYKKKKLKTNRMKFMSKVIEDINEHPEKYEKLIK